MTTTIIDRLNATLNQKTEAALSQLAGLEQQIAETIAQAEAEATARIEARLQTILTAADEALCGFTARITAHAADAFQCAVDGLAERLAPIATQTTPEATPEPDPIPQDEGDPIPTREEVAEHLDQYEAEQERHTPAVAAYALDQGYAATIDDDDGTDDDLMETAADHEPHVETTDDPRDLYERRGQGRGTRYVRAEFPTSGETYFRKVDNRWTATTYVA